MFCTNCGKELENDCKFCVYCGEALGDEPVQVISPATQTPTKPKQQVVSADAVPGPDGVVYDIEGVRGRRIRVFEDKCVLTTRPTIGALLTANATDGEKTIYYVDCIGVQYKKSGLAIGYLQLETASGMSNNKHDNFFNENTFTFDPSKISNESMEIVANYIKKKVDEVKRGRTAAVNVTAPMSVADEILKLKELLDMGILTQEEFDAKKKQLLGI